MEVPQLYIRVLEACNLPGETAKGFIQVIAKHGTAEVRGILNEGWRFQDEQFLFHVQNHRGDVDISLNYWATPNSNPKLLGEVKVPLASLYDENPVTNWHSFQRENHSSNSMKQHLKLQLHYTFTKGTNMGASLTLEKNKRFIDTLLDPNMDTIMALVGMGDHLEAEGIVDTQILAEQLVEIIDFYGMSESVLKKLIEEEVQAASSIGVLFRGCDMKIKMISAFVRMSGKNYLLSTLEPAIKQLVQDTRSCEIDISRMNDTDKLACNALNLSSMTDKVMRRIYASLDQCPGEIKRVCQMIRDIVSAKFPDQWKHAVGAVVFLRFFGPACVSPDSHHLLEASITTAQRRQFLLVTKTMQNLVHGILQTEKEDYMGIMENFISANQGGLMQFLDAVSQPPSEGYGHSSLRLTAWSVMRNLECVCQYLAKSYDKMVSKNIPLPASLRGDIDSFVRFEAYVTNRLHNVSSVTLIKRGVMKIEPSCEEQPVEHATTKKEKFRKLLRVSGTDLTVRVLNDINEEDESLRHMSYVTGLSHPCELSEELLIIIYNLYVAHLTVDDKREKLDKDALMKTDTYKRFAHLAGTLRWANLYGLTTQERIVFFLNMSHTLLMHLHIILGPPGDLSKSKQQNFFTNCRYNIGGELFSLNMMRHGILRGDKAHRFHGRLFEAADKRNALIITHPDPQCHFAFSNLTKSSAPIQVFSVAGLNTEMADISSLFCQENIHINAAKHEVELPEVFQKYAADFPKTKEELLTWLTQFLSDDKRYTIQQLLNGKFQITYKTWEWETQTRPLRLPNST